MLRRSWRVVAVAVVVLAVACSGGSGGDEEARDATDLRRSAEAGGITVEARWLTQTDPAGLDADVSRYPPDAFVLLELSLDTHEGDLSEIDLETAATLRQGRAEDMPEAWVSRSDDSHHREGVLVFPRSPGAGPVELAIALGDEGVVLSWDAVPGT